MTVALAIREAALMLAGVSDTPRLDAELLMAEALGVSRSDMLVRRMDAAPPAGFAALLSRRRRCEPIAQILGRQEFHGHTFIVTRDVLIPRADSETLIEAARGAFARRGPERILDLGTGSGALLLAALKLWPDAVGVGLDRSPAALDVAAANADALGLALRARLIPGDWDGPEWSRDLGTFDLILANPPYVETAAELAPDVRLYEPAGALYAGPEGLEAYRSLVPQLAGLLVPRGCAILEIGAGQAEAVAGIAAAAGFAATLHHDLAGRPRALTLKKALGKPARAHYLEAKPASG